LYPLTRLELRNLGRTSERLPWENPIRRQTGPLDDIGQWRTIDRLIAHAVVRHRPAIRARLGWLGWLRRLRWLRWHHRLLAAGVGRVALPDAVVAVALITVVVIRPVWELTRGVLVVGVSDATLAWPTATASIAVLGRATVAGRVVGTRSVGAVAGELTVLVLFVRTVLS
jgi:hypothetical protein